MTDEDALNVVKQIKYEYVPKGTAIRRAGKEADRLCFIMQGKVVISLPSHEDENADKKGSAFTSLVTDTS